MKEIWRIPPQQNKDAVHFRKRFVLFSVMNWCQRGMTVLNTISEGNIESPDRHNIGMQTAVNDGNYIHKRKRKEKKTNQVFKELATRWSERSVSFLWMILRSIFTSTVKSDRGDCWGGFCQTPLRRCDPLHTQQVRHVCLHEAHSFPKGR